MRKAAAGLPHSKSLLRNIMRDSVGRVRDRNAFASALAKIRERYHFLLLGMLWCPSMFSCSSAKGRNVRHRWCWKFWSGAFRV